MDSNTFDSFSGKIAKVQSQFEERLRETGKLIEDKVGKEDIERLEKKNFAHVSKIFYNIQKYADKEEVTRRFAHVEDMVSVVTK